MDFIQATDRLGDCPTHGDLANVLGVDVQRIRQARLGKAHVNRRPAPDGWEKATAKLARKRAEELVKLAEELEAE